MAAGPSQPFSLFNPIFLDGSPVWGHNRSIAVRQEETGMEPIRFEFTPTKEDYLGGYWAYFMRGSKSFWLLIPLVALFALCGLLGLVNMLVNRDSSGAYFLAFLIAPAVLALVLILQPLQLWLQVSKNDPLRVLNSFEVDSEHWSVKTPFSETRTDWGTFSRLIESPGYFLLIHSVNKRMFNIIPKRAFPNDASLNSFRRLVLEKLGGRGLKKDFPVWLIAVLVPVVLGGLFFLSLVLLMVFSNLMR